MAPTKKIHSGRPVTFRLCDTPPEYVEVGALLTEKHEAVRLGGDHRPLVVMFRTAGSQVRLSFKKEGQRIVQVFESHQDSPDGPLNFGTVREGNARRDLLTVGGLFGKDPIREILTIKRRGMAQTWCPSANHIDDPFCFWLPDHLSNYRARLFSEAMIPAPRDSSTAETRTTRNSFEAPSASRLGGLT